MGTNKAPLGEIVAKYADPSPINDAIKTRAEALAGEMNPEAAKQFILDMQALQCTIRGEGDCVIVALNPSESYLIEYLKDHDVPVAGGDNGTAHNVDGTVYQSDVNPNLWNTELDWLELPHIDGEDEADRLRIIMSPDCLDDGFRKAENEIEKTAIIPEIDEKMSEILGGGSK